MSDTEKDSSSRERALSMMAILTMISGTEMESSLMPVGIESQAPGKKIGSMVLEKSRTWQIVPYQLSSRTIWQSQAMLDKINGVI